MKKIHMLCHKFNGLVAEAALQNNTCGVGMRLAAARVIAKAIKPSSLPYGTVWYRRTILIELT